MLKATCLESEENPDTSLVGEKKNSNHWPICWLPPPLSCFVVPPVTILLIRVINYSRSETAAGFQPAKEQISQIITGQSVVMCAECARDHRKKESSSMILSPGVTETYPLV